MTSPVFSPQLQATPSLAIMYCLPGRCRRDQTRTVRGRPGVNNGPDEADPDHRRLRKDRATRCRRHRQERRYGESIPEAPRGRAGDAAGRSVGDRNRRSERSRLVAASARGRGTSPAHLPAHASAGGQDRDVPDRPRVQGGRRRFVLYSVLHPLLVDVPHHARKLEAERYLVDSGQVYTILQPGRYMQHLAAIWKTVLTTGVHSMPFGTKARFSVVDLTDLADATANVLTSPGHEGATYQLAGPEALSQDDMASILTQVLGRPIRAAGKPLDEF